MVAILPEILISNYSVPFYFGGTSLLIVVTVTLDTVGQIQSHLHSLCTGYYLADFQNMNFYFFSCFDSSILLII